MAIIETASQQRMRQINMKTVFRLIQTRKQISRAELARLTKLSPTTISVIVEQLIAKGLVAESAPMESKGAGRRAIMLEVNDAGKYVIGVQLDPDGVSGTVFNLRNEPVYSAEEKLGEQAEQAPVLPETLIRIIHRLVAEGQRNFDELIGICVGVAGMLDADKKSIVLSTPLHLGDIPLFDRLREHFAAPIYIENETQLAAAAEREQLERKASPFIYLAMNDGLGISVIHDEQHLQGANGTFLEMGHMSLHTNGEKCFCGNRGCFERYVSKPALLRHVARWRSCYPGSALFVAEREGRLIDEKIVAEAAAAGDRLAQRVVRRLGTDLGNGLVNLIHLFNPETIMIGGKLSVLGEPLLERALQQVQRRALRPFMESCRIVLAEHKGSRTSIGGAIYALNKWLEQHLG